MRAEPVESAANGPRRRHLAAASGSAAAESKSSAAAGEIASASSAAASKRSAIESESAAVASTRSEAASVSLAAKSERAVVEPTPYARAQAQGQEALRASLLDIAAGLLAAEGPSALTMRRIAAEAGCSTTVLYKYFGAKDAIADALYREGFARLKRRLDAVPRDDDPAEHLAALGRAYRASALAEPNFYDVMHGRAIPGFTPDAEARAVAEASLEVLHEAARDCVEAGVFRRDADPDEITEVLWAAAHGVISLELAGHFRGGLGEERFRLLTGAAAAYFVG